MPSKIERTGRTNTTYAGDNNDRDLSMRGRKATLNQEVAFFITTAIGNPDNKKKYPKGTEVSLSFYQVISDLYVFNFKLGNGEVVTFPLRRHKFEWKD
jgi:hypothetical protein